MVRFLAGKNDEAKKQLASIKDKVRKNKPLKINISLFIDLLQLNNQEQSNGLHYACCNDDLEVLKYLIEERKFPINYKDKVI